MYGHTEYPIYQAIPSYKVLIIEECHLLTIEACDEFLGILEGTSGSNVVFVLITSDADMVPRDISSICHKFCFQKLRDTDIALKLMRIVSQEDLAIDIESVKLIVSKADGSLREAETTLD